MSGDDELNETLPLDPEEGERASAPPGPVQLGHYRIVRVLGRGGMGAVYEAIDVAGGGRCAVKTILDAGDPEARARFRREAELLARVSHPNVGKVRTAVFDHDPAYLVQDLYGASLRERLRKGPLPLDEALDVTLKLASALDHLHERGVLHRDLKPQNVLFDDRGEPRLVDFGLARDQRAGAQSLTRTGDILGSPKYMAPEQAYGEQVDARSDVYGLGGLLYAMLTGCAPFEGSSFQEVLDKVTDSAPTAPSELRADLPPAVVAVCLRALEKRRNDRYPTPRAMAEALRAARSGGGKARPPALLLAGLALALLCVGLVFALTRPADEPSVRPLPPRPAASDPGPGETALPAVWTLARGDAPSFTLTRTIQQERALTSTTLVLRLEVKDVEGAERRVEASLARLQCRFLQLPVSEYSTAIDYDTNYPDALRRDAYKGLDALKDESFSLTIDARGRVSSVVGLDPLRRVALGRITDDDPSLTPSLTFTHDAAVRACISLLSDLTFSTVLSALLRLPAAEGEEPSMGRARYDAAGRLLWAIGEGAAQVAGREARTVDALYATGTYRVQSKRVLGKADTLSNAARVSGTRIDVMAAVNNLDNPDLVRVDDTLVTPAAPSGRGDAYLGTLRVDAERLPVCARPWGPWIGVAKADRKYVLAQETGRWARIGWGSGWGWVQAEGVSRVTVPVLEIVAAPSWLPVRGEDLQGRPKPVFGYVRNGHRFAAAGRALPKAGQEDWIQVQFDDRPVWVPKKNVAPVGD